MKHLPNGLAIVLLACGLAGCPARTDDSLYAEDFERTCDGTPCGWAQIGGEDGAARYVETLPGDHGLELVGDDVTVRGVPEDGTFVVFTTQLAVRATARCDLGSILEIRVTFEGPSLPSITFEGEIVPDTTFSGVLQDTSLRPVDSADGAWSLGRVLGISLRKSGPGSCEIDYLALRSVRSF